MNQQPAPILEHRINTADTGWAILAAAPAAAVLLILGLSFSVTGLFWKVVGALLVAGIAAIAVMDALTKIKRKGIILHTLTEHHFTQQIPDYYEGESFHIPLTEIDAIEHHSYKPAQTGPYHLPTRTIHQWFLHASGSRHHITSKQAKKFADKIHQLHPTIKHLRTGTI